MRDPILVLFSFMYFIWLLTYVAFAFRGGARAARGVTHWRMKLAALGAILLAFVFVLAVLTAIMPPSRAVTGALTPLAALGAAANYYFAFAPPSWLRRLWQSSELYEFLAERAFVVLPKAALFVADDLSLLRVCCTETAAQIDNAITRERQEQLIDELGARGEQLAAVNKELEAFSYSVSHDLRAPLRHIPGFTDLLQKSAGPTLDPGGQRYLRLISETAVKMGELIDPLLVFSRMVRSEMLHTRVDLNTVVRQAQRDVVQSDPAREVSWPKPTPLSRTNTTDSTSDPF